MGFCSPGRSPLLSVCLLDFQCALTLCSALGTNPIERKGCLGGAPGYQKNPDALNWGVEEPRYNSQPVLNALRG